MASVKYRALGFAIINPQTEEFAQKLRTEALSVVKKLRNHTSIFLWAGDNECDLVYTGWHPFRQNPNENIFQMKFYSRVSKLLKT